MAGRQPENLMPQDESNPPQQPEGLDPARAKKDAILDHIVRTLTSHPWCMSTSKDDRLSNLSVYFEFKQLLEDDKAICERIEAKKATTEGKLKAQIETLKERLKTKDAKAAENTTKLRTLEAEAAEKDRDLESKANDNSALNVKIRRLEAEAAEKDESAEGLRRDKSRLRDRVNELKKGNASLAEQVEQLKLVAEAAKKNNRAMQELRRENAELKDRIDELTEENASLTEQIKQLKLSAETAGSQKPQDSKHVANNRDDSTVSKTTGDDQASTPAEPETRDLWAGFPKAEFIRRSDHILSIREEGRKMLACLLPGDEVMDWERAGHTWVLHTEMDYDDMSQLTEGIRLAVWEGDEVRIERTTDGSPIVEYNFGQPLDDEWMRKLFRKID